MRRLRRSAGRGDLRHSRLCRAALRYRFGLGGTSGHAVGADSADGEAGDAQRYDRENLFKNARAETLFEKWPWRMLWQHNRCIIPVTGFYEPHRLPNGKAQYYYTTLKDQELFSHRRALGRVDASADGEKVLSFVLITTEANAMMRKIHNGGGNPFRMPKDTNPRAGEALARPVHRIRGGRRGPADRIPRKGDDSMARAAEVQLRRPLRRRNYRAGRGNADARTLNAKLHDSYKKRGDR